MHAGSKKNKILYMGDIPLAKACELSPRTHTQTIQYFLLVADIGKCVLKTYKMVVRLYEKLSYDVASRSEITPCNKICKPLVVYRFSGNVMTSITTLRT